MHCDVANIHVELNNVHDELTNVYGKVMIVRGKLNNSHRTLHEYHESEPMVPDAGKPTSLPSTSAEEMLLASMARYKAASVLSDTEEQPL